MAMPVAAFQHFTPVSVMLPRIDKERHPAVRRIVHDAFTPRSGSVPFGSKQWLAGYRKYGDHYEAAAERFLKKPRTSPYAFYEELEDPWMSTGYAEHRLSPTTLLIAERHARVTRDLLPDLMRVVVARGMAPKALQTAADWYSGGQIGRPAMFAMGWPTLVFGGYAAQWTPAELVWLTKSGISPDDYLELVLALIAHPTEPNQVQPPRGGLSFEVLRLIIRDGMPLEYAVELANSM